MRLFTLAAIAGCAALSLTVCSLSNKRKAKWAEQRRVECLDKICEGDVVPKHDPMKEEVLKINGRWLIGPKEYFSSGMNGAAFEWWEHRPLSSSMKRPPEVQAMAVAGKGYDVSIEVFLRSNNIPPEPHGYKLIELAERKGWIAERKTLRPGLDAVRMKHVVGPAGYSIDHVTYYVATDLKGVDNLPPVATCNHDHESNGGGTGFMWRPGIWLGTRWNQKHCADWPEIYQEIVRVMSLITEK